MSVTKVKWNKIMKILDDHIDDKEDLEIVLTEILNVLKFDPNKNTYTPEVAKKIKDYRDKMKLAGVSTYVTSGVKTAYHKKKNDTQANQTIVIRSN